MLINSKEARYRELLLPFIRGSELSFNQTIFESTQYEQILEHWTNSDPQENEQV